MNVVFMGTPDFAVRCFLALLDAGHTVSAVFTMPDKPVGRDRAVCPPPVKRAALRARVPVFQPATLRDAAVADGIRRLNPDVIAVAAYGRILPPEVLEIPRYGCVNVHASLLPKYRGASPVAAAILAGERETGVTTMRMDEGLDTGDLFLRRTVPIREEDTAGSLTETLAAVGAELLIDTLSGLSAGTLSPVPQDDAAASFCGVLRREDGRIGAELPARAVFNRVRGLYPWPGAYFLSAGKRYKIIRATVEPGYSGEAGMLFERDGRLFLACADGQSVEILEIQPDGKRRMTAGEFLRGARLAKAVRID